MIGLAVPDPYSYVRAVTIALATVWTIGTILRVADFADRWQGRFESMGLSRAWLRRQVLIIALRTTFLDPINLALMMTLVGSWTLRSRLA